MLGFPLNNFSDFELIVLNKHKEPVTITLFYLVMINCNNGTTQRLDQGKQLNSSLTSYSSGVSYQAMGSTGPDVLVRTYNILLRVSTVPINIAARESKMSVTRSFGIG